jgi:hypothetical protein
LTEELRRIEEEKEALEHESKKSLFEVFLRVSRPTPNSIFKRERQMNMKKNTNQLFNTKIRRNHFNSWMKNSETNRTRSSN